MPVGLLSLSRGTIPGDRLPQKKKIVWPPPPPKRGLTTLLCVSTSELREVDPGVRHLRVLFTEAPANHAIVSWTTTWATEENVVRYDTVSRLEGSGRYAFEARSERDGQITLNETDETEGVPPGGGTITLNYMT